jgi:hypothetical protein
MKKKILADITPYVHPTKDILQLQGLIKLVTEISFKASEGPRQLLVEGTRMLTAKRRLR